jgi:hypothetical protein
MSEQGNFCTYGNRTNGWVGGRRLILDEHRERLGAPLIDMGKLVAWPIGPIIRDLKPLGNRIKGQ